MNNSEARGSWWLRQGKAGETAVLVLLVVCGSEKILFYGLDHHLDPVIKGVITHYFVGFGATGTRSHQCVAVLTTSSSIVLKTPCWKSKAHAG